MANINTPVNNERKVFGPFKVGDKVIRRVRGIIPVETGIIQGESEFGGLSVKFPSNQILLHLMYWELQEA